MTKEDIVIERCLTGHCPICNDDLTLDEKRRPMRVMKYNGIEVYFCAKHEVQIT